MALPNKSVDVITALTIAHWFDVDTSQTETPRVLTNNGTLAIQEYDVPISL